ncbi:hypothetical protein [Streptomyces cyaneofuscatus]|uniref:hypothetical protein n=1 Tax=Streptomyces cyaneofuscatus TaxID=66883 RepID=UPI00380F8241
MGLLVEAREMSAMGPDGLLFTSVSAVIRIPQLAVISGPSDPERTALILALAGRFTLAGGTLHTDPAYGGRPTPVVLRERIAVAQAPPTIALDPFMRVREVIAERRLLCGNRMSEAAVHGMCALMRIEMPPAHVLIQDLDPVERLLLSVALAGSQQSDGIAVADVDVGLTAADRRFVQGAMRRICTGGKSVLATSADGGWGDIAIDLVSPPAEQGTPDGEDNHSSEPLCLPTYADSLVKRHKRIWRMKKLRATGDDRSDKHLPDGAAGVHDSREGQTESGSERDAPDSADQDPGTPSLPKGEDAKGAKTSSDEQTSTRTSMASDEDSASDDDASERGGASS